MKDMSEFFLNGDLQDDNFKELIAYLNYQLKMYSDLSRERNYLWKQYMETIFR